MLNYEEVLWNQDLKHVAGVDEVGRGALAGPVVAAAVILPPYLIIDGVQDSKALRKRAREHALTKIHEAAVAIGIGYAHPKEIDELNIAEASLLAMHRAVTSLKNTPEALLVDGNRSIINAPCQQQTIIKGDQKSQSIAAASIVAKITRDRLMQQLHEKHPAYGWNQNVGYPTKAHYSALHEIGPSIYHRYSFRLL